MKKLSNYYFSYWRKWFKFLQIMKIYCLFTFFCVLQVSGTVYSQNTLLNLDLRNKTVREVLRTIEDKSEFRFFYNDDFTSLNKVINLEVKQKSIDEILQQLFSNGSMTYKIMNDNLVVILPTSDQQLVVTGTVTDATTGEGIPGVNVLVEGTTNGVITDQSGQYNITIPGSGAVLIFSSIGYLSEKVIYGNKNVIDVKLSPDITTLEEVVVVSYGTQRKIDLTGSVSAVSGKDISKVVTTDPILALQGKAAGLEIIPNSGQPGAVAVVRIRGVQSSSGADPIYVIDGIISSGMGNINTNDIESVSILKDAASTALYGSRAAGGVVVITTKKGSKKDPVISFHTYQGIRTRSNLMPKLLNSKQYLQLYEEAQRNGGQAVSNTDSLATVYGLKDENGNLINTDWLDVIMRKGTLQYYDLSVSGGSEKSTYFTSVNYLKEKGMFIGQGQNKVNFRLNTDHKINKVIEFGNTLNIYNNRNFGTPSLDYTNYNNIPNPYWSALIKVPTTRAYEEADGTYGSARYEGIEGRAIPPHIIAEQYKRENKSYGVYGNLYLKFNIVEGLTFTPRISLAYDYFLNSVFMPIVNLPNTDRRTVNSVGKYSGSTLHWQADYLLNYEKTFLDLHHISAMVGYSQEEQAYESLDGSRTGTPNDQIRYLDGGDIATANNSNKFEDWSYASYLGRINYDFNGKYLLQATVRRDGTSRFLKKNRWSIFPSYSVGWRISKESFFEPLSNIISDMKIRGSYGTVGNAQSVGLYTGYPTLTGINYILNENSVPGYAYRDPSNKDLTWETIQKTDIGLDMAVFNSKLTLTADYYVNNTVDLLYDQPIPYSTGKGQYLKVNGGELQNKGIEVDLGFKDTKGDFSYSININFSRERNSLTKVEKNQESKLNGVIQGNPIYSYYGYKTQGIIKNAADLDAAPYWPNKAIGDIWKTDINGNDTIDSKDLTIIGRRYPELTYGLTGSLSYKRVSLSIQMQGVQGIDLPYTTGNYFQGNPENNNAVILNRFDAVNNPSGTLPAVRISDKADNLSTMSEMWLTDASYLRINNVNLTYDIPKAITQKAFVKEASIYMSVQNLYTFTRSDYKGVDVDVLQPNTVNVGINYYGSPSQRIPLPRTWIIGVKVNF